MFFSKYKESICGYEVTDYENKKFCMLIDSIDLGNKTESKYRDYKLCILADLFLDSNIDKTCKAIAYAKVLCWGKRKAFGRDVSKMVFEYSIKELGVTDFVGDIKRNRSKLLKLQPIFVRMGNGLI